MVILPLMANADAVEIDGIYYNLVNKVKVAEVTSKPNGYEGNVTIPATVNYENIEYSVTSIGESAFWGNNFLTVVTIPNSVTSIKRYAFAYCSRLTTASIPNSVTSIGENVFQGCSSLTSVTIPNTLSSISSYFFDGCKALASIIIPTSVTTIGSYAFCGCINLTSIIIPTSVTSINSGAFKGCSGLTTINIPNSVNYIQSNAFEYCSGLTSLTINNSVLTISGAAFKDCSGLTSVIIGNSVGRIYSISFGNCSELSDVYCLAESVPETNTDAFEGSYIEYATLHVPAGSVNAYQAVEPWSNFNKIIAYDEISVSSSNIRTYSSPFDLDLSNVTGLSAYVISNYNSTEGTLTLSPVTTVKAGEGLLLKGEAGDYNVPYTTSNAAYTNYLVGVPTTTSVSPTNGDYTNFVLADGTYGVNFYALSKTGNISAGKAYLRLPTAEINQVSQSRGFSFIDGGTTSIQAVRPSNYKDGVFYDLQGRRVNNPSKGLYIMNGKKVIIK